MRLHVSRHVISFSSHTEYFHRMLHHLCAEQQKKNGCFNTSRELQTLTQSLLGSVVTQQSCIVCKQASVQWGCQKEGLNNARGGSDRQEVTIETQKHKSSIIQEDLFPQILLPLYCSVSSSCRRLCNFKESLEWKWIPPMLSQTIKQQKKEKHLLGLEEWKELFIQLSVELMEQIFDSDVAITYCHINLKMIGSLPKSPLLSRTIYDPPSADN